MRNTFLWRHAQCGNGVSAKNNLDSMHPMSQRKAVLLLPQLMRDGDATPMKAAAVAGGPTRSYYIISDEWTEVNTKRQGQLKL